MNKTCSNCLHGENHCKECEDYSKFTLEPLAELRNHVQKLRWNLEEMNQILDEMLKNSNNQ